MNTKIQTRFIQGIILDIKCFVGNRLWVTQPAFPNHLKFLKKLSTMTTLLVYVISSPSKGPDKRGQIVADTLLMMFLGRANARDTAEWMLCFHAAQTGKHLVRAQNVSEQNQKHFLCPGHKICVRNKCCARGQTGKHLCRQQPGMCPQQNETQWPHVIQLLLWQKSLTANRKR